MTDNLDDNSDGLKKKAFEAATAGAARKAASDWLSDFTKHGPLQIESVRVFAVKERYVAVVTYAE
jgi:hypothetical protein